jgi:hypothetical protein
MNGLKSETSGLDLYKMCSEYGIPLLDICFKDQLNNKNPYQGCYIINMANSDSETHGTHWIGLFLQKYSGYFFDSFGMPPPLEVEEFCKRLKTVKDVKYNSLEIQSLKLGGCGEFVVDFLAYMNRYRPTDESFYKFLRHYQSFHTL